MTIPTLMRYARKWDCMPPNAHTMILFDSKHYDLTMNIKIFISELRFTAETLEEQLKYGEITWLRSMTTSSLLHAACKPIQGIIQQSEPMRRMAAIELTLLQGRNTDTPLTFSHTIHPGRVPLHMKVLKALTECT